MDFTTSWQSQRQHYRTSIFLSVNNLPQGGYDVEITLVCSHPWINMQQLVHRPKSSNKAQAGSKFLFQPSIFHLLTQAVFLDSLHCRKDSCQSGGKTVEWILSLDW